MRVEHFVKKNGTYKISNTYGNATYNFCEAIEGNLRNRVISFVIKLFKVLAPNAVQRSLQLSFTLKIIIHFHSCPLRNVMEVKNVSLNLNGIPLIGDACENMLNVTVTKGKSVFLAIKVYYAYTLKK